LFRKVLQVETVTIEDKSHIGHKDAVPLPFFCGSLYNTTDVQWKVVAYQGGMLSIVVMLESFMTLEFVNDLTGTQGHPNQQLWAVAVGNIIAGFFGTMGGNALIELSVMNVKCGGVGRVSSALAPLLILAIVAFAYPLLNLIPCGALGGIMVVAVLDTFRWSSLPSILASFIPDRTLENTSSPWLQWLHRKRIDKFDSFCIVLVTVITIEGNLAVSVAAGLLFVALRFSYQAQQDFLIEAQSDRQIKTYFLKGQLFFAAKEKLNTMLTPDDEVTKAVHLDFTRPRSTIIVFFT